MFKFDNNRVLYVLGPKNSGKTTFNEVLIKKLRKKNYTFSTIKFTHKPVITEQDQTKDTTRFKQKGSLISIFATPIETSISIKKEHRDSMNEIMNYMRSLGYFLPKIDIIICESLNNPPANSKIILAVSNKEELSEYYKKLKHPILLGIVGKIANYRSDADRLGFKSVEITDINDEKALLRLLETIEVNFNLTNPVG